MAKEYLRDKEKWDRLIDTQYRKNPKWKIHEDVKKNVIIIFITSLVVCIILSKFFISDFDMSFIFIISTPPILIVIYSTFLMIFKIKCSDRVYYKMFEVLKLNDDGLEDVYRYNRTKWPEGPLDMLQARREVIKINYKDIKRMVLNKYHERLCIYGNFYSYTVEFFDKERNYEGREFFYMYYEDNEEILKILSEKSGVEIEEINEFEVTGKRTMW